MINPFHYRMEMKITLLVLCCILPVISAQLKLGFYSQSCPQAEAIVLQVVRNRFITDRSIPAALLRLYFHDCFVRGCDASLLIDSTPDKQSEKESGPNFSVRGYDLIDEIKKQLEAACPSTVSCSDVVALATRDSVALAGGPSYSIPTGRRDGLVSDAFEVDMPGPDLSVPDALRFFTAKGMDLNDMVTLLGAHTVGITHCSFIQDRLFNFQGTGEPDRSMDPALVTTLSKTCQAPGGSSDPQVFLDQNTSFVVDNQFYSQVIQKRGILPIDVHLGTDISSAPIVARFASDGNIFNQNFVNSLIKLGNVEVLVGTAGEIRKNCRVFNPKGPPKSPPSEVPSPPPKKSPPTKAPSPPPKRSPPTKAPSPPPKRSPPTKAPSPPPKRSPPTKAPSTPPKRSPPTKAPNTPHKRSPPTKSPSLPPKRSPPHKAPSLPPKRSPPHKAPPPPKRSPPRKAPSPPPKKSSGKKPKSKKHVKPRN